MKKLALYIGIVMGGAAVSSCSKDLDALPTQSRVEGNVVVDQKSAEIALNGVYNRFVGQTTVRSNMSTGWSNVNEILPAQLAGWIQYGFGRSIENTNLLEPGQTAFYWTYYYNILNAANVTIAEVEALADTKFVGSRKKEILAEARFLRAYAHYSLLSLFAEWYKPESALGVLLRKEPLQLSNGAQKRSTVKESFDFIFEDLDYAIANAADVRLVGSTEVKYYINKTAARALKMRVLMMRGTGTDHTTVISLANEIDANKSYALEPNLRDLFQVKGLASKEVIFGITPYPNQTGRQGVYEYIQSSVYLATKEFRDLLANDPRKTWMYKTGLSVPPAPASIKDSSYFTKYSGPKVEESYVLRLTEVYLLKAEAIVRSGGNLNDARNILRDSIMKKAGVTDFTEVNNATTADQLLVEIYKEVARNMTAEAGIEWLFLRRLPLATITQLRPTIINQMQLILPVPATEFQLNPTFGDQNTGYPKI